MSQTNVTPPSLPLAPEQYDRQYMDKLRYIFQENRPALERHLQPTDAMIKDLAAMHISSHSVQTTMLAAGGKAN